MSVVTPSIYSKNKNKTILSSSIYHPSNPNPQAEKKKIRYKGIRDLGYTRYEKEVEPTEVIRFGKRVSYETKMSQHEVMEDHLKQMRINILNSKQNNSVKKQQEKEFLN